MFRNKDSIVRVDIIAGARPNFMKIAPIIQALEVAKASGSPMEYRLVHTGQHYDSRMSGDFFRQLGIPEPHVNLAVGSGTQAEQAGAIMMRYEALLLNERSAACLVVGDVTSTMACAIAAQKLCIPVGHVEGGIRSGDWTMPEEINRLVTDSISNWFFTTSEMANSNLRSSGVGDERIFFVGNTMIDTLLANMDRFCPPSFWSRIGLQDRKYLVATLHRPANVDSPDTLVRILNVISEEAAGLPVVFPVHPRTAKTLAASGGSMPGIFLVDPQPYLEFNYLVRHSLGVITDSGGVTEEATVMGVPCMTARSTTERPETVSIGTNELVGTDPDGLRPALRRMVAGKWKRGGIPEKWDGRAGVRIVEHLSSLLRQ